MNLSPLSARIKLQRRQQQEWDALVAVQKNVWVLVKETNQQSSSHSDSRQESFNLKRGQFIRFTKMMTSQSEERKQMKMRHQQEVTALEDVIRN